MTVEANRISVALSYSGVIRTIALDILNIFWQKNTLLVAFTKSSFIVFMIRYFFSLVYFLVVEDYELFKSTSHLLRVPVSLEHDGTLSWSISFFCYISFFPDDVLCKIVIWADDTTFSSTKHLTWRNKLKKPFSCNLILKIKSVWKYFNFSSAIFDFRVSRFGT